MLIENLADERGQPVGTVGGGSPFLPRAITSQIYFQGFIFLKRQVSITLNKEL